MGRQSWRRFTRPADGEDGNFRRERLGVERVDGRQGRLLLVARILAGPAARTVVRTEENLAFNKYDGVRSDCLRLFHDAGHVALLRLRIEDAADAQLRQHIIGGWREGSENG